MQQVLPNVLGGPVGISYIRLDISSYRPYPRQDPNAFPVVLRMLPQGMPNSANFF